METEKVGERPSDTEIPRGNGLATRPRTYDTRRVPRSQRRRNPDSLPSDVVIVLGLNAFSHDAAAALLVDGRIAFAASEERFDRVRFSAAFPSRAIAAALSAAGVGPQDVDAVAVPWTRSMARARKALWVATHLPRSLAFLRERPDDLQESRRGYLAAMRSIERRVREAGIEAPVRRVPHHVAHAASAALVLPGASGPVVTADGMGEWTTAAHWRVERGVPTRLREARYPHSPGKAYAAVTAWLGFRPEADEGKTMGLAAYGDPAAPAARFTGALLSADPAGLPRVDVAKFGFPWGEARLHGDAFLAALGPPRRPEEPLRPGDADAARGIQDAVEAWGLAALEAVATEPGEVVGAAGGLFLNCAMNGRLAVAARERHRCAFQPFPVAGDAGAAVGAAALVHRLATGRPAEPLTTLRLGTAITPEEAWAALGPRGGRRLDLPTLAAETARRVDAGRIVGVARGRAELGPRALGGRSVLARADDPAVRDDLNRRKGRELWRPTAPVLLEEALPRWFDPALPSPWMITTLRATPEAEAGGLRGAAHRDGTARVQSVTDAGEPFLAALLRALEPRGHVAVINTSLNRRGEPIVDGAEQALAAAEAMRLDAIVIEDVLLDLVPSSPP
jgi:carbamoyltransferase